MNSLFRESIELPILIWYLFAFINLITEMSQNPLSDQSSYNLKPNLKVRKNKEMTSEEFEKGIGKTFTLEQDDYGHVYSVPIKQTITITDLEERMKVFNKGNTGKTYSE